jgi:D-glycero-alpha-D-manno-heptose-7-phosphate kinase
MIITRTPYRISFFGGGTDYPAWYRQHGGAVLSTTIDKYCYISCRYLPPFFEQRYRLVYSKIENVMTIDEIVHPAVREGLRFFKQERGLEIHHDGDLPARSGMGSSSAFMVGLLHTLHALNGQMPGKKQLALEAIDVEQNMIHENVGSQDQIATAFGGFNHTVFHESGEFSVRPVTLTPARFAELNGSLMLFYTGIKRTASDVAASYTNDLGARKRQLRILKDLVDESITVLTQGHPMDDFGALLHESWLAKRSLSAAVSNAEVEAIYAKAQAAGALGGKLLGAGGGGFILFFVPADRQGEVFQALDGLVHVPFSFESTGSQVIFFEPEANHDGVEARRAGRVVQPFHELGEVARAVEPSAPRILTVA